MKILRIIPSMNPKLGGPCQGIRNSIPELQRLGIENEVVCLDNPDEQFLMHSSFIIHALGSPVSAWAYNQSLRKWLLKNLCNYDIVIIHGLWLYHSFVTMKVLNYLKTVGKTPKVYVMPHGMLDPWFQKDRSRKLKAVRNELYWRLVEKKVVNDADGLLFTCEQEMLLAKETFKGYNPKRELNVGYGIPTPPTFSDITKNTLSPKPYWLFLSRIHPKKGIDILIHSYKKVHASNNKIPDLVIAGSTDTAYAKEMMELARDFESIRFVGMLQGSEKWEAFYNCEAFILPSHQENFGIAVVEALACSKGVLISNQVNIWREIETSFAGLVEDNSIDGIVKLLKGWLQLTREQKEIIEKNAYWTYTSFFSAGPAANKLKNLLEI